MTHHALRRRIAAALAWICCLVWVGSAVAASTTTPLARAGHLVLSLAGGAGGPLVLAPAQGVWMGQLTVTNEGTEPLTVSRVAIRGDEDDVRSPSGLSVRFADGVTTAAIIAPGASKDVVVTWAPEKNSRVRQAFGHVIVTSTDEHAGEVAMGFRAQLPTGLGWVGEHILSLLVLWPLVVVLVSFLARLGGRRDEPLVRRASIAASFVEVLLALWAYRSFAPDLVRVDGNEGFQLVERFVWVRALGIEWYLGVDGTSILLLVLAASTVLAAVLVADEERRSDAYYTLLALLASAMASVLVALDLVLLFIGWSTVLLALVVLVGGWGRAHAHRAAAKLGVIGMIGLVALLVAFAALSGASGPSYLVDGTALAHTMSIPELARTSFAAKPSILGVPFVELTWALLFVAVVAMAPLVPLHGWLPDVLAEGPAGASIVIGGIAVALGPYLLIRVGLGALPEGARWAGPSIAVLGAIAAVWGALCATAQRDLRRFVAYAIVGNAGLCLYGIGAFTPQGIAGAVMALFAHGVASVMMLAIANAFERRVRTCDVVRLAGLGGETPVLATVFAVGLGASVGVPGLVGSWGVLLAFVGGVAQHPVVAGLLGAALVVSAAAHVRVLRLLVFERVDPTWRTNRSLDPFGGRVPDATSLEMAALVPLAVLALVLGLWPVPALSAMELTAHDVSAAVAPTAEGR
jgi:NADH-quinone oxidoreductase subunit M